MYKAALVFFTILLVSCSSVVRPSKQAFDNQSVISKQEQKIEATVGQIEKNDKLKKSQTSSLAYGIQYSLQNVSNAPIEVSTAIDLNDRIISIVGAPHIDEANRIKAIVNLLNSSLEEERNKGRALLSEKDKIILSLQKTNDKLEDQYDLQLQNINDKAREIAKQADSQKATIDSMGGMMGLNAVFWGLKRFFITSFTWIIVFCVIFLILRILSTVNPIAAVAFSVFNIIGSSIIGIVKQLTPKAFELSNLVSSADYSKVKGALTKIVDSVQELVEKQKDSPDKTYTLQDILDKFSKQMDRADKNLIEQLLKEQKWKN